MVVEADKAPVGAVDDDRDSLGGEDAVGLDDGAELGTLAIELVHQPARGQRGKHALAVGLGQQGVRDDGEDLGAAQLLERALTGAPRLGDAAHRRPELGILNVAKQVGPTRGGAVDQLLQGPAQGFGAGRGVGRDREQTERGVGQGLLVAGLARKLVLDQHASANVLDEGEVGLGAPVLVAQGVAGQLAQDERAVFAQVAPPLVDEMVDLARRELMALGGARQLVFRGCHEARLAPEQLVGAVAEKAAVGGVHILDLVGGRDDDDPERQALEDGLQARGEGALLGEGPPLRGLLFGQARALVLVAAALFAPAHGEPEARQQLGVGHGRDEEIGGDRGEQAHERRVRELGQQHERDGGGQALLVTQGGQSRRGGAMIGTGVEQHHVGGRVEWPGDLRGLLHTPHDIALAREELREPAGMLAGGFDDADPADQPGGRGNSHGAAFLRALGCAVSGDDVRA